MLCKQPVVPLRSFRSCALILRRLMTWNNTTARRIRPARWRLALSAALSVNLYATGDDEFRMPASSGHNLRYVCLRGVVGVVGIVFCAGRYSYFIACTALALELCKFQFCTQPHRIAYCRNPLWVYAFSFIQPAGSLRRINNGFLANVVGRVLRKSSALLPVRIVQGSRTHFYSFLFHLSIVTPALAGWYTVCSLKTQNQ